MIVVIPARAGSKGFPKKNQVLFDYTAELIKDKCKVIVTSDDDKILERASNKYSFNCLYRKEELCTDEASVKDVMLNAIEEFNIPDNEFILMLYLTYPERTWKDIEQFLMMFHSSRKKSILCAKEPKTHPFMCVYSNGKQIAKHNLYRRQDYPVVYEISHFMQGAMAGEYKNLNSNLYNDDTLYFFIDDKIDVDRRLDYDKFMELRGYY